MPVSQDWLNGICGEYIRQCDELMTERTSYKNELATEHATQRHTLETLDIEWPTNKTFYEVISHEIVNLRAALKMGTMLIDDLRSVNKNLLELLEQHSDSNNN